MNANSNKVQVLISRMKVMGIEIADVSVYPMTQLYRTEPHDIVIIAGYLPGKACLMTVDTDFERISGKMSEVKFTIDGELIRDAERIISPIERKPVGSESYDGRYIFSINTYTDSLDEGFAFFRKFLTKVTRYLRTAFTKSIHFWYVPEYSDAVLAREKRFGKYDSRVYEPFQKKVFSKLPRKMFAAIQKP